MVYFPNCLICYRSDLSNAPFWTFSLFSSYSPKNVIHLRDSFCTILTTCIYCTFKEKRCQNFGAWTAFCMLHKNNVNQSSNHLWNVKMASAALRVTRALCADLITTRPALNIPLNIRLTSVKFLILQDIQPDISWINHQF